MAVGDIYQVIDTQVLEGQTMLNVYFYKVQSESISDNQAVDVCNAYIATVLPVVKVPQNALLTHTLISAKNLFNESDAHTEAVSVPGSAGGIDVLGTFEAFAFKELGDNQAVRNGSKRIAGASEDIVTDGVITAGTAALNAIASVLFADLPWGLLAAEVLIPVIVKRLLVAGEYKLPTTSGEAVTSHVIDASWSPLISSQVSRKVGRGE